MFRFLRRARRRDTHVSTEVARGSVTFEEASPTSGITADQLWDLYAYNPRAKIIVEKVPRAAFHAGFTNDVDREVVSELQRAFVYARVLGWAAVVVGEDGSVQAWNARAKGVGAEAAETDEFGRPSVLKVYYDADDQTKSVEIDGPGENFFIVRTLRGLPGWRGLSVLSDLYATLVRQESIVKSYTDYAKLWGISLVHVKDAKAHTSAHLSAAKNALEGKLRGGEVVVTGEGVDIQTVPMMSGSYDPINILGFIDTLVSASSGLNRHLLTGDPEGHLTSSEVSLAAFYATVKEFQDEILPQVRPILARLGYPEDTAFNDPSEMPSHLLASYVRDTVAVLKLVGVSDAQIIEFINQTFQTDFVVDPGKTEAARALAAVDAALGRLEVDGGAG